MKSKVFFVPVEDAEDINAVNRKLDLLLAKSQSFRLSKQAEKWF